MSISKWPVTERPREKVLKHGVGILSDAELLAIFIRTGSRGLSAIDIARKLIADYGGLRAVLEADCKGLCQQAGIGPGKYAELQAVPELASRCALETLSREKTLASSSLTKEYLRIKLRGHPHEVFVCLFLDNRNRIIAQEELFRGTIDGAVVYPREVVKRALFHNSAAVIFAHNHPSGVAEPSQADISITRRLCKALDTVEIRTLDHLVIGDREAVSMAERGLM